MIWILKEKNYAVTEYYFSILKHAAETVCDDVVLVDNIEKDKRKKASDIIIVGTITKAMILFLTGYKNIIVWFQGVSPEESYMRNNDIIRKKVLEFIEINVLKRTRLAIFVSQEMKEHYEKKYNINTANKYYIMPCFNTNIVHESFFKTDKYNNNVFAYTGGLSPWQGFDKILACYENIEKLGIPNTKLLVLTPDKDKALEEIKKTSITNYEIGYTKVEELPNILADAKFGFIIRENNIINRVSTPTKISTYTANGLIPIYSECIKDFNSITKGYEYKLSFDSGDFIEKLQKLMVDKIDPQDVYDEYSRLFALYYNPQYHSGLISYMLKSILNENQK